MKAKDKEFDQTLSTVVDDDLFEVLINHETEFSSDGGYTFERETAFFYLTIDHAKQLRDELDAFIKQKEAVR